MKHWTFWGWIAYGCLAISAYGTAFAKFSVEYPAMYDWLPLQIRSYMGYMPATLVSIATIILIIQWIKDGKATEVERATMVLPPNSVSPLPHVLSKPKKFYSDRNKSDLANALTDLSEILNKYGPNIMQKAQYVIPIWNLGSSRISSQDITNLIAGLNEIGSLANSLYQTLHNDNGFINKYIAYNDELGQILHNYDLIPQQFIGSINRFRNVLMTIQRAEKHDDRDLINLMMADSRPAFDEYMKIIRIFKEWFDETPKRIAAFRNSYLN